MNATGDVRGFGDYTPNHALAARLSYFKEPIAPFQKVVASHPPPAQFPHEVRQDHGLEAAFGFARRVVATVSSQVR